MEIYSFFGPFFAIPSTFLAGFSAASGIHGKRGIYGGLAPAGVSLFASAMLVVILPEKAPPARPLQAGPS